MKNLSVTLSVLTALVFSACMQVENPQQKSDKDIVRYERDASSTILKGVYVPEGKETYITSGLVAAVKNADADPSSYERYGNTYEQSMSTLSRIKETLEEAGFGMEDVVQLRIYLAPDAEGVVHWQDWFDAYANYFNNEENKNKVARTTLAVHSLARPDLLVEIEAVAVK